MSLLPHSAASEQAIIGMLMLDNTKLDVVKGHLPSDEFYIPFNKACYEAIIKLAEDGLEASPISLSERLEHSGVGTKDEVMAQLVAMFDAASVATDLATYAFLVSETAFKRSIITKAKLLTDAVEKATEEEVAKLQEELALTIQTYSHVVPESPIDQLRASYKAAGAGGKMMPTYMRGWDDAFGGIFSGSRYIIAGHGGVGKSAFTANIAWNMAASGKKVRWITFEEDSNALWWRIQSRFSNVHIAQFRNGLNDADKAKIAAVASKLNGPDFLVYKNIENVGTIIQTVGQCDLVVIDGITSFPVPSAESKVEKAGIVTEYAKTIADKTGAAVIMLSHVNSDGIKNGASMTSLYGGQAATFDPEGIVELRFADKELMDGAKWREVKMHVIKNRYGPPNITKSFMYEGQYQRYGDME